MLFYRDDDLRSPNSQANSKFFVPITEKRDKQNTRETVRLESQYSDPDDSIPVTEGIYASIENINIASAEKEDNIYEEQDFSSIYTDAASVKEANSQLNDSEQNTDEISTSYSATTLPPSPVPRSGIRESGQSNQHSSQEIHSDAESIKCNKQERSEPTNQSLVLPVAAPRSPKVNTMSSKLEDKSHLMSFSTDVKSNDDDYDDELSVEVDVDDLFETMSEALKDVGSELAELKHPLREEDTLPLQELSDFLSNNPSVCRSSYKPTQSEENPVEHLKQYLATLNT